MRMTPGRNTLFYGDNLDILRRQIADESVDLVYLDPPFNSSDKAEEAYDVVVRSDLRTRRKCSTPCARC